jgi:uncharacterized protein YbaP (TraB family)
VFIVGAAPPVPEPRDAPEILALLENCPELWVEAPRAGPELQSLAIAHGVVPGRPLKSWLEPLLFERVRTLGEALGVAPPILEAVRPWLAGQLIQMAALDALGASQDDSIEGVLLREAASRGIPVRHEFETLEAAMRMFSELPPRAEAEYLSLMLDDAASGPEGARERNAAWSRGDLASAEAEAIRILAAYPAFWPPLIQDRNHGWLPRIHAALEDAPGSVFVIGTGHLVGPGSVIELLSNAGLPAHRL